MEAEPQRWAATYTKHLKQKRKAYHDGALLLYPDLGRLVLLDDAGDTLESRFLRASEEVSAGAALSFHSYLVDVGEPEAILAVSRASSSAAAAAARTAYRGGVRARPPSAAGRFNPRVSRAFVNPPKSSGAGSGAEGESVGSGGADEAADSRFQEWTALYTSQMTQKAKKYHDGVVRLVQTGPRVKQIILLDEDGQVLGSRHLKSGESIESGKKCIFPNYLIEICEAKTEKEGTHSGGPIVHTSAKSTSNKMGLNAVSKSQKFNSLQNLHDLNGTKSEVTASSGKLENGKAEVAAAGSSGSLISTDSGFKEWNALYTTQLTQKAKKYHDGVLRLMQIGSSARQIVLLDEDGGVLGSRYLKSVESIESGTKCQIPNYLIEVTELRNEGRHSLEEVNQTGQKSEENACYKRGAKSKSPNFVSPFKSQDARKSNCESTTSFHRPKMNSHDVQKGTSTNSVWPEVGKSWLSSIGDPLKFHDRQYESRGLTNFIRKEVGKSSFGNMDDSVRTASQILSIMKPPPEIKLPQSISSGPAQSLVSSSNSRILFDATHTNNLMVDDSNRTFDGLGHSGLSHFATQLRSSVQSCLSLDATHTNNSVVDASNRTSDASGHSGLAHFSTQLRNSVKSCLSLETPVEETLKKSVIANQWNESSGNSHSTPDIMRPEAFNSQDLAMVDILASEISNAKEQQPDSSNHHMGSSSDTVPSDPGLQDNKSRMAVQLSTQSSLEDQKCDASLLLLHTLTCKDHKIQELIDDCPSFDLGF